MIEETADITKVPADVQEDLDRFGQMGVRLLEIGPDLPPHEIVAKLKDFMNDVLDQKRALSEEEVIGLGVLLGDQYVTGLGWHWRGVTFRDEPEETYYCVLSPDNVLGTPTISWMMDIVAGKRKPSFMSGYNLIRAGQVPPNPQRRPLMLY